MPTKKSPPQNKKRERVPVITKGRQQAFAKERAQFKALLLSNPNYFGNLKDSEFEAQLNIQFNTFYESIGCVGYQPQANRLEAVVFINESGGYGGGVCSNGTSEFIRFYISFDNGATWQDLGLRNFTAYDIPGTTPKNRLEYAVTLPVQLQRKFCFTNNLARVRAILSWNVPPPSNTPDFPPVWGEVHNTNIQIEPLKLFKLGELFETFEMGTSKLTAAVDVEQTVSVAKPKALHASELKELYKGKDVEPHRFALTDALKLIEISSTTALSPGTGFVKADLEIYQFNVDLLFPQDGNTRYEQLECVGLSPDERLLCGIIRVKLSSGYSGSPCTAGSKEFVTFWADTDNNGTFETCLGTTSVTVYDVDPLPDGGLEYAVFLPVDLEPYRQACKQGARLLRIRAILSWQQPPPCANPNFIPIWGNREETLIQVQPGVAVPPGTQVPLLTAVGDILTSTIDSTGLAQNASALQSGARFDDAPFGGRITLAGKIVNGTAASKYRIMRKSHGAPDSAYVPLTNEPTGIDIPLNTWDIVNGLVQTNMTIHADANGYYNYQDYASDHFVQSNILSKWFSTLAEDNNAFDLRLQLQVDANPDNDLNSNVVTILVDNTAPEANLKIDLGTGVDCADFDLNATFTGRYTARDLHFGGFSFVIRPQGPAHGVLPVPAAGSYPSIPDPGVINGIYTLNTTGMDACGYALTLEVRDRTNVNSGQANNTNEASVGFCLREPKP